MPDPPNQVIYPFTNLEKFDHKHSNFLVFEERLEQSFIVNNIKDGGQKRAILLCSLNEECYILLRNLCTPRLPETKPYEDLVTILIHFSYRVQPLFAERLKFYTAQQEANECLDRVKSLVANCDFGDELQVVMRDIFTIGLNKTLVREKCFEEDPSLPATNLAKMAKTALSKEAALNEKHGSQDHPGITVKTEPVHYNQQRNRASGTHSRQNLQSQQTTATSSGSSWSNHPVSGTSSQASGHRRKGNCICHKCGITGHLASVCKSTKSRNYFMTETNSDNSEDTNSDNHEETIYNLRSIDLDDNGNVKPSYVKLLVENVPISFEADSGKTLCANDLALKDYIGMTFEPLGYLSLNVVYDQVQYVLKVYVVKNGGPPLIGRNGLNMLNLGIL
ncbi:hypothetical protein NQ317_009470 [Molorchus minor]|uniref:CCHC-type domain-containing protein n=1 Tax=Molorchus minor TaxID=1323400 RepID=A0ABQ9J1J4_9CUCU|nr:hypothetical protein NQ317_009470 [Molorchus minor]